MAYTPRSDASLSTAAFRSAAEGDKELNSPQSRRRLSGYENELVSMLIDKHSPRWMPDEDTSTCGQCDRSFTFYRRRHHCRICGHLFCDGCSKYRLQILGERFRVCDNCYASHQPPPVVKQSRDSLRTSQELYNEEQILPALDGGHAFPFPYTGGRLVTEDAALAACTQCKREVCHNKYEGAFRCGMCGAVNNLKHTFGLGLDQGLTLALPAGYVAFGHK
eukprot:GFYU01039248.1.p1 GENE.GFYU01039248.1~~GFYU01039248.1.p1  ORF type:complete len:220 (+),score=29.53 GFYU01039248.1:160-819(+)